MRLRFSDDSMGIGRGFMGVSFRQAFVLYLRRRIVYSSTIARSSIPISSNLGYKQRTNGTKGAEIYIICGVMDGLEL